jgi:hypothetical protein
LVRIRDMRGFVGVVGGVGDVGVGVAGDAVG